LPYSIPELQQNDDVTVRNENGAVVHVVVQSVSTGRLDYDDQPFFLDTTGHIHWSGRTVILDTHRTEPTKKKVRVKDPRNWREQITTYADGTPKTFREILLSREDGKTFEDEVKVIVDGSKDGARGFVEVLKATALWFPRQFPKIDTFDLGRDPRSGNLLGYRPAGINEEERFRIFRTGSEIKIVDNKEGSQPRRFGTRYITYFGVGLIALPVLVLVSFALGLLGS